MDRRHFLHNMTHVMAAPTLFSSLDLSLLDLNQNPVLSNTIDDNKILILLQLNGGNDGLNTIIPLDSMSQLNNVRPNVVLPDGKILNLGSNDLGIHPSLPFFKSLFTEDKLKIIQGVGYPIPNYSHFRSMDIWQSASDANKFVSSGWLGRYIENKHPNFPQSYPNSNYPHPLSLEIGNNSSLLFTGEDSFTNVVTSNPASFYEIINDFNNEYPDSRVGSKLKYLQLMSKQSNLYGSILKESYEKGNSSVNYTNTEFGNKFDIITKLISGGLKSRIYMLDIGGFDTHGRQVEESDHTKGQHASLLSQVNDNVSAFMRNMEIINKDDDVLLMTFSEFGRTVHSNATFGTDHGSVSPVFLMGNNVNPSISGANPYIPNKSDFQDFSLDQYEMDLQFDFRQIYFSVLSQWFDESPSTIKEVLFKDFNQIPIIKGRFNDTDGDGVPDESDLCNDTPIGVVVNPQGCVIFSLLPDNYSIQTNGVSCAGKSNGQINISVQDTSHVYNISIPETSESYVLNSSNQHRVQIDGLGTGNYTLNISVEGEEEYLQTFEIGITQPGDFSSKTSINKNQKKVSVNLSGSEMYLVELNGVIQIQKQNKFELSLLSGYNSLKISTPHDCQGIHKEEIFISEQVEYYPNPMVDDLTLVIPGVDKKLKISIYSLSGTKIKTLERTIPQSRMVRVNVSGLPKSIYVIKVKGTTVDQIFKVQKK